MLAAPAAAQPALGYQPFGAPQAGLKVVPVTIATRDGKQHSYRAEVAATTEQQAIGMMHRRKVPPGTGMLFPMRPPRAAAFYMRNTLVPLDIIFIGSNGRVLNIVTAVPLSEELVPSAGTAAAVLELAGGEGKRIGLKPGDRIRW